MRIRLNFAVKHSVGASCKGLHCRIYHVDKKDKALRHNTLTTIVPVKKNMSDLLASAQKDISLHCN